MEKWEIHPSVHKELTAKRGNCILGWINHSTVSWSKEVILLQYLILIWPHLEYHALFWAPQYNKN